MSYRSYWDHPYVHIAKHAPFCPPQTLFMIIPFLQYKTTQKSWIRFLFLWSISMLTFQNTGFINSSSASVPAPLHVIEYAEFSKEAIHHRYTVHLQSFVEFVLQTIHFSRIERLPLCDKDPETGYTKPVFGSLKDMQYKRGYSNNILLIESVWEELPPREPKDPRPAVSSVPELWISKHKWFHYKIVTEPCQVIDSRPDNSMSERYQGELQCESGLFADSDIDGHEDSIPSDIVSSTILLYEGQVVPAASAVHRPIHSRISI